MLHIIRADAGCDKTAFLIKLFAAEAADNPQLNYVYIVPEQFTMSTQKKMVMASSNCAIMNIDVLSFNRLAYRVFTELGTVCDDILMETGKNLLIRRVAQEKEGELKVLKANMKKPGYISQMKSLISELTQYRQTPDDLADLIGNDRIPTSFQTKAADLLTVYRGFLDAKKDRYITADELLEKLLEVIDSSSMLKGAVIAFDGFTGFTPLQRALLDRIIPLASEVYVTVTIAEEETFTGNPDELSLFAMSRKMKLDLDRICADHRIPADIVSISGQYRVHSEGGYLDYLQKNIFRINSEKSPAVSDPSTGRDAIRIIRTTNPEAEVKYVAAEILRLVREKGYRFQDIAVVSAGLSDYRYLIDEIFKEARINVFIDSVRPVLVNPALEYLRSLFEIALDDMSYEGVMKYLRSGLSDISEEKADRFENYLLACGIRGSLFKRDFVYLADGIDADDLADVNETRKQLISELSNILEMKNRDTVLGFCRITFMQLHANRIEEKIRAKADAYDLESNPEKAQEYRKVYSSILDILEKMADILGEEEVTAEEFDELLEAGLEEVKLAVIPPDYDSVTVGDIERTRLEEVKALFLLGATDNLIPKKEEHGGLLSQMDRQMLLDHGIELAPTDRQRQAMQRFYLYMLLSRPSETLYVTYTNVDGKGEGVTESYLVHAVTELFRDVEEETRFDIAKETLALGPSYIRYFLADYLRAYLRGDDISEEDESRLAALKLDMEGENTLGLKSLKDQIVLERQPETISPEIITALIGSEISANAYNMECYGKCPYEYFLKYLLRLKERGTFEVSAADLGELYHGALELYSNSLTASEYNWANVPDDVSDRMLDEAIEGAMQGFRQRGLDANPREQYIFTRARQTLSRTVWAVKEQVRAGSFTPCKFELSFDEHTTVNLLWNEFDQDYRLKFGGKVDRIDTYTDDGTVYVKIVDYKSSETKLDDVLIRNGLQVQLILYMNNAIDYIRKQNRDKDVLPGAMFYYHIDDPFLDKPENMDTERLKKLKPEGLFNENPTVVSALDAGTPVAGKYTSAYIPFSRYENGCMANGSRGISAETFEDYRNIIKRQIASNVVNIHKGLIDELPYQYKDKTACGDFCNYHSICCFDDQVRGCRYRELDTKDADADKGEADE